MSRQLDLIRRNALSSHQMMTAAKGALHVPAGEMVEILVYIAENNKIFGEQARITLAAWDENSAKAIASDPATPKEVLDYWVSPKNLRPALFPLLLENSSVSANKLGQIGSSMKGEWIDAMLASPRVRTSRPILHEISTNKELSGIQTARLNKLMNGTADVPAVQAIPASAPIQPGAAPAPANASESSLVPDASPTDLPQADTETENAISAYLSEHAAEISAEGEKPFQPLGGFHEEIAEAEPRAAAAAASSSSQAGSHAAAKTAPKKLTNPQDEQRGSVLQKIASLDIKGRIQLAMKGTKEERSILIRDGTKIVALAVLDSPKLTDGEVEKFASQ
jgi:hypothetical protein